MPRAGWADGLALEAAGANEGADVWGADMAHIISRAWVLGKQKVALSGATFRGVG